MVQSRSDDVIAFTNGTVGADKELGHDEQRDSLGASGRVGQFGEHQMDDVVGDIVVSSGDPHLRAEKPVGAVVLRFSAGRNVGQ